jgi:hypothetical protein
LEQSSILSDARPADSSSSNYVSSTAGSRSQASARNDISFRGFRTVIVHLLCIPSSLSSCPCERSVFSANGAASFKAWGNAPGKVPRQPSAESIGSKADSVEPKTKKLGSLSDH